MTRGPDPAMTRLLAAGGEMGRMIAATDWSGTTVGPPESWPPSLWSTVRICLASRFPMLIFWGPDLSVLYNDSYMPLLGSKHPASLGQPAREVWSELWPVIGPMMEGVFTGGHATFSDDLQLMINRHGYREETYWTFSYSPILDETGAVGGVFCAVNETTQRVLVERRLDLLRALGARTAATRTVDEACRQAAETLGVHVVDLPFTLIYLLDDERRTARLAGHTVLPAGEKISPLEIPLDDPNAVWPLAAMLHGEGSMLVDLSMAGDLSAVEWQPEPPRRAVVLTLERAGADGPAGFVVTGINPHRVLDGEYRSFLGLVADRIAAIVADAAAHEAERRRAEALAEIDRVKTEFFANVSHEFRTPLTLLLGPLEDLLADNRKIEPDQRTLVESAHRSALRLLKLVNTLLDFARLEAGRSQASYQPVDLAASTADLVSAFRSAIDRAGLTLVVDCPPLPEAVCVDRDMWEKIVFNLLSNAFKFTLTGEIRVTVRADGGFAVLSVADTGVGIPAAELPKLFDRFHRVPEVLGRTHEGTGIGLSLVRELVMLHGGAIEVTSLPGHGSTFSVCLPFGSAHLPDDRLTEVGAGSTAVGAAPYLAEATRWLPDESAEELPSFGPAQPAGTATGPVASASAAEVLVVDDNADLRDYLRRLLTPHWRVRTAADGAAALRLIDERQPDLVLTDVMMPVVDGFELLRRLRADERTRDLPVILVTARAGQESTVDGLTSGANDYLVKPFTVAELVARVRSHLETARMRRAYTARLRRIIDAGAALTESVPSGDTGRVLAEQLLEEAAGWCAIWLVHRDLGGQDRLALHLAAAASPEVAMALHGEPDLPELLGVPEVITSSRPHAIGAEAAGWPAALRILTENPVVTLPLTARGGTFGAVTVAVERGREDDLLPYIEEVVRRGALAMDNARLFQNERRAALSLQRSLLPPRLPRLTGATVAARYLPGAQGTEAGGDWYDVIVLADGRIGLSVGDVMGRGMQAAALMGQVRSALRSYAMEGMAPATMLDRLDAFLIGLDTPQLTTCLYAILDPASGELRIASAGHPPPLLVPPPGAGEPGYPPIEPGLPLGLNLGPVAAAETSTTLAADGLLLMFTDGLIETHDQPIDAGLARLREAYQGRSVSLAQVCDVALAALGHVIDDDMAGGHDDIALLAVRRDP